MFWLTKEVAGIIRTRKPPFLVETGVTPSGPIHIGHLREVLTADALVRGLVAKDKPASHLYFSDTHDPLRKVYPFLPASYKNHVGKPLYLVPSPVRGRGERGEKGESYAEYFVKPFLTTFKELGIEAKVIFGHEFYKQGKMTKVIDEILQEQNRKKIFQLIKKLSCQKLEEDEWQPFNPLCQKCQRLTTTKVLSIDIPHHRVQYSCQCGYKGWADYSKGEGKLPWRIDWPARWKVLQVKAEPFGKDHAVAGGSYEVGRAICEKVLNYKAPYPVPYEFIYLRGQKGKMSSSLGNTIEAGEFTKIVPPEVARYLILRSPANRHLTFNPGLAILQLTQEFAEFEASKKNKALLEVVSLQQKPVSVGVSFSHLVMLWQAAQGQMPEVKRLLKQTGHKGALKSAELLKKWLAKASYWLKNYAPEVVRFEIQRKIPPQVLKKISPSQKKLLTKIAEAVLKGKKSQELHNFIYETGKKLGLTPKETFEPIYLVLLGKTSGPKAGFFLSILPAEFVAKRFKKFS